MSEYKVNYCITVVPYLDRDPPVMAIEDLLAKRRYAVSDAMITKVLDFARDWTERAEIERFASRELHLDEEESAALVDRLVRHDFLVGRGSRPAEVEAAIRDWEEYGWDEAVDYYLTFYEYPFPDHDEGGFRYDRQLMREYLEEQQPPNIYKTYDDAAVHDLPEPSLSEEFSLADGLGYASILDGAAGDESSNVDEGILSTLLYYTFGEIEHLGSEDSPLASYRRTSPSGGARHPVEAYVAALDVDGVSTGLYHYSVKDHALEVIPTEDVEGRLSEYVPEIRGRPLDSSFVVLCTAKVDRSMWRYREPRTYTVVHNDFGHLVETLRILSTVHDFTMEFGYGVDERGIADLLGVDVLVEPPLGYGIARPA